ncbi:hypothetical protein ACRRTK_000179 [Alexandromys fortis]
MPALRKQKQQDIKLSLATYVFREHLLSPGTIVGTEDITFTREDSGRRNSTNMERSQHLIRTEQPKVSLLYPGEPGNGKSA